MKNFNYIFVILACALLALSATSCKDKDKGKDDEPKQNQYTFDGTTYPILSAGIIHVAESASYLFGFSRYGNEDTDQSGSSSIRFVIGEEQFGELIPNFEEIMFIDTTLGITDLVPSPGTLKVVKNGDNFTVDFDVTLVDELDAEHRLTGHYSGAIEITPGEIGPTGPTG